MLKNFETLEMYPLLIKAKEELFSCFRQILSPSSLPSLIEYEISCKENDENEECIRAFCYEYEGLFFEALSLRADDGYEDVEGYAIIWYKDLEGLDLRDKVVSNQIK